MNTFRVRLSQRPRLVATAASLLVLVVSAVFLILSIRSSEQDHRARLEAEGGAVVHGFEETVESVTDRLAAIAGLFHASDLVTPGEFRRFVNDLGLPEGVAGVGMAVRVEGQPRFLADVDPGFSRGDSASLFSLDGDFNPQPLVVADHHDILIFVEPSEPFGGMLGLDLSSAGFAKHTIETTIADDMIHATPLLEGLAKFDGFNGDEFVVVHPITRRGPAVDGIAVALVALDEMIGEGLAGRLVSADRITVRDVTGTIVSPSQQWSTVLTGFGRQWQVEVAPEAGFSVWTGRRIAFAVLAVLVSAGAGTLLSTGMGYRNARIEIDRLARAQDQTDRLLGVVSHELRTPLTALLGFLEEVHGRWDELTDEERRQMIAPAWSAAVDMTALVDDLLVRERIVSDVPLPLRVQTVDLADTMREVIAWRGLDVRTIPGVAPIPVAGDPARVRQILRNLFEHTHRRQTAPLEVELRADGATGVVTVGVDPIPDCCLVGLFDLTVAAVSHSHHRSTSTRRLELAVARYLATAMGGDLAYDAESHTFVLRIPLAAGGVVAA